MLFRPGFEKTILAPFACCGPASVIAGPAGPLMKVPELSEVQPGTTFKHICRLSGLTLLGERGNRALLPNFHPFKNVISNRTCT